MLRPHKLNAPRCAPLSHRLGCHRHRGPPPFLPAPQRAHLKMYAPEAWPLFSSESRPSEELYQAKRVVSAARTPLASRDTRAPARGVGWVEEEEPGQHSWAVGRPQGGGCVWQRRAELLSGATPGVWRQRSRGVPPVLHSNSKVMSPLPSVVVSASLPHSSPCCACCGLCASAPEGCVSGEPCMAEGHVSSPLTLVGSATEDAPAAEGGTGCGGDRKQQSSAPCTVALLPVKKQGACS